MDAERSHLQLVRGRIEAIRGSGHLRVRLEGPCILVEGGRGRKRFAYLRLRRMDASKWQREELSDRAATLRWVRRGARAPLERLLRRWDDADTHWEDFRIEGAGTDDAAPPIE